MKVQRRPNDRPGRSKVVQRMPRHRHGRHHRHKVLNGLKTVAQGSRRSLVNSKLSKSDRREADALVWLQTGCTVVDYDRHVINAFCYKPHSLVWAVLLPPCSSFVLPLRLLRPTNSVHRTMTVRLGRISEKCNPGGILCKFLAYKLFGGFEGCWIQICCMPSWEMTTKASKWGIPRWPPRPGSNVLIYISFLINMIQTWIKHIFLCFQT